jgi:Fic family protein
MRFPKTPPKLGDLLRKFGVDRILKSVAAVGSESAYWHWDKLRHLAPPEGVSHEEWWAGLKLARSGALKSVGLLDKQGRPFRFAVPEFVAESLHWIDLGAGGMLSSPEDPIANPHTRDRYLIHSLMEEAITSSQLEGAATTRKVAREMIRTGREPRDTSERMILNNFLTMQRIREWKDLPLTPERVFEIHRIVTEQTLDDASAAGRFRARDEQRFVGDDSGEMFHEPPPAGKLPERMAAMCAFANCEEPGFFVHPVARAIILHFWLAYDHPFVDGNGRTARALFYWSMLRSGYWLFEFVSISSILRKAPAQYARSFLYTETDENDLTYFIVAQCEVIRKAIQELHDYIERKSAEFRETDARLRALDLFNHRQVALIRHALKHPDQRYTIRSHQRSHGIAYQTARTDLLSLVKHGLLAVGKVGKQMVFTAERNLPERLKDHPE